MTLSPSRTHILKVQKDLEDMSNENVFIFATACIERQWPVYQRASQGQRWDQSGLLRGSLDMIWGWLCQLRIRPASLARECETAVLEDVDTDEEGAAFHVSNSIYALASIVESNQPQHGYQAAQSNLDLIDAFLYERLSLAVSDANDALVDAHELMKNEMEMQCHDLVDLNQPYSPSLAAALRGRSTGHSLLGGYWYS